MKPKGGASAPPAVGERRDGRNAGRGGETPPVAVAVGDADIQDRLRRRPPSPPRRRCPPAPAASRRRSPSCGRHRRRPVICRRRLGIDRRRRRGRPRPGRCRQGHADHAAAGDRDLDRLIFRHLRVRTCLPQLSAARSPMSRAARPQGRRGGRIGAAVAIPARNNAFGSREAFRARGKLVRGDSPPVQLVPWILPLSRLIRPSGARARTRRGRSAGDGGGPARSTAELSPVHPAERLLGGLKPPAGRSRCCSRSASRSRRRRRMSGRARSASRSNGRKYPLAPGHAGVPRRRARTGSTGATGCPPA